MSSLPSPSLAAALSFLFPGLGQVYAGAARRGLLLAIPFAVFVAGIVVLLTGGSNRMIGLFARSETLIALLVVLAVLFFYHVSAVVDAYRLAQDRHRLASSASSGRSTAVLAVFIVLTLVLYGVPEYLGIRAEQTASAIFRGDETDPGHFIPVPSFGPDATARPTPTGGTATATPTPTQPGATGVPTATPPPDLGPISGAFAENGRLDLLLIGGDAGSGRTSLRTDTMILLSVDIATGRSAMFGFPRNITNAPLPAESAGAYPGGRFPEMLSALWRVATENPDQFPGEDDARGWRAITGAIQEMAGVPLDGFVAVDLNGFVRLVDAVGGVWVDVPERIVDENYPTINNERIRLVIEAGCQVFDGQDALAYSRSRHQDSDYQRMKRQQLVLQSVRRQFDPISLLPRVPELLSVASDNLFTSINRDDIAAMAQVAQRVDAERINQVRFQTANQPRAIDDAALARIRDRVRNIFSEPQPEPTARPSDDGERCPPR